MFRWGNTYKGNSHNVRHFLKAIKLNHSTGTCFLNALQNYLLFCIMWPIFPSFYELSHQLIQEAVASTKAHTPTENCLWTWKPRIYNKYNFAKSLEFRSLTWGSWSPWSSSDDRSGRCRADTSPSLQRSCSPDHLNKKRENHKNIILNF